MLQVSQSLQQGGPAVITVLVVFMLAAWASFSSGTLRFGREADFRDKLIEQLSKINDDLREANADLIEANRLQAQASQTALDLIRQDLLPRLGQLRGG